MSEIKQKIELELNYTNMLMIIPIVFMLSDDEIVPDYQEDVARSIRYTIEMYNDMFNENIYVPDELRM
jgi:hypothetical protein